jgi:hypothetical protein
MYCIEGTLIRYGKPEPWKVIIQQIGRSKPSRAPKPEEKRRKNNGRPPDTSRELLGNLRSKTKATSTPKPRTTLNPSYPWSNNSCFLDTSLELIFQAVMRDFQEFSIRFKQQETDTTLSLLHRMFELRKLIDVEKGEKEPSTWLAEQRDNFREHLRSQKIIASHYSFEPLFVDPILHWCAYLFTIHIFLA